MCYAFISCVASPSQFARNFSLSRSLPPCRSGWPQRCCSIKPTLTPAPVERDAGASARAVMESVDRDWPPPKQSRILSQRPRAYSQATSLDFYARANNAIERSGIGNNVVLTDASGQQVLNTLQPLGQPLPRHGTRTWSNASSSTPSR